MLEIIAWNFYISKAFNREKLKFKDKTLVAINEVDVLKNILPYTSRIFFLITLNNNYESISFCAQFYVKKIL